MKKKTDLRVIRTKKMIIEAFVALSKTKEYEEITIQEIADAAMINRATFYAHFKDKQDLYDQILEVSIKAFAEILDTEKLLSGKTVKLKKMERMLTKIFQVIQENKPFFSSISDGRATIQFRQKLIELLYDKYEEIFKNLKITENDIEVPIDFIVQYMTSIFLGTVHWLVNYENNFNPDHMARLVIKLVGNGHLTVLGIEIDRD
ncbi:TetR/AcrR family transcriptional regulator [Vagococcus elongatus]|uniref:TetR family transcriptional regulator n=1 Tax=Vagococcus elongatus TaxID=180344 RepID=A0A430AZJ4_9ENTE|nr:TetR/AcrR family transcriptional regulator [Vagococcus elongatus]RSU13469.1 TetR family transcriptional regulator [Vagococcus elongatus]